MHLGAVHPHGVSARLAVRHRRCEERAWSSSTAFATDDLERIRQINQRSDDIFIDLFSGSGRFDDVPFLT